MNATGFPSGVAGVPAEVVESLTPLVQHRRELRTDSGGPGIFRGGLGQCTEMGQRMDGPWSVSAMIDRIRFPAPGLEGGGAGAPGEFAIDGSDAPQPKALLTLAPGARVRLNPPGGGGYGPPLEREPERVLEDVINGYVSVKAAEQEYGVAIQYLGVPEQLVRLPEDYEIDAAATARRRTQGSTT